jgi:hypothetical protein
MPRAARSAGSVRSRRYGSVVKLWHSIPSATLPATPVTRSPTAASSICGVPCGFGPGLKKSVIKVWW